jgi:hypothetical protein
MRGAVELHKEITCQEKMAYDPEYDPAQRKPA